MDKIVQLTKDEYDDLFEKANLNQKKIKQLARKMYDEKGCSRIDIRFEMNKHYESISFKPVVWVSDTEMYEIPYEAKKKIIKEFSYQMNKFMMRKFGEKIRYVNIFRDETEKLRHFKLAFIGLTVFGWLSALALVILSFN